MMKISKIKWEYEDKLPPIFHPDDFNAIFKASKIKNGVRMYPYIEINEEKIFLSY